MKLIKTATIVLAVLGIAACSTTKKSASTTPTATTTTTIKDAPSGNQSSYSPFLKPENSNFFVLGNEELTAIQAKYKDVTMQTLMDGHALYIGVCTNCHGPKNIYKIEEQEWPSILDNMAQKAEITAAQKDAVNKYVLAIKATQPLK